MLQYRIHSFDRDRHHSEFQLRRQLRIPERLIAEMDRRAGQNGSADLGGLLIGYPIEQGYWVERILICRNADADSGSYRIDDTVVRNVTGTLGDGVSRILGIFVASADGAAATGQRTGEPSIWLTLGQQNGNGRPAKARRIAADREDELEFEIVPTKVFPPTFCPE